MPHPYKKHEMTPRYRIFWLAVIFGFPLFIVFWYPHLISYHTSLSIPCVRCWFVGVDKGIGFRVSNDSDHIVIDWRLSSETLNWQWGRIPAPFGPDGGSGGINRVVKTGTLPKEMHVQWVFDNGEQHSYLLHIDRPSNFKMHIKYGAEQPWVDWNLQISIQNSRVDYAWDLLKVNKLDPGGQGIPLLFATSNDAVSWIDGVPLMIEGKDEYWSRYKRYEIEHKPPEKIPPDWPEGRPVTLEQSRRARDSWYKMFDEQAQSNKREGDSNDEL